MKPTLLILAAGMGSRYGSMKQTEGFGPGGETIIDYSIYDAIKAGFGKVVFIIRKDFEENFRAKFNPKLKGKVEVDYVFQEMDCFVKKTDIPKDRTKPWGTGHALLCAWDKIKEPFAIINADDFYGRDAFEKAALFLKNKCNEKKYAIIGYYLNKTLSEHGSVSRGVCEVNAEQKLISVKERTKIYPESDKIIYEENGKKFDVASDSIVSMNFWCFHPSVFEITKNLFENFIKENKEDLKAEFFIPIIADYFIQNNLGTIEVIPTIAQWFGVTYKEDAEHVKNNISKLIAKREYPSEQELIK